MHWRHQWRVAVLVLALVVLPSVAFVEAEQTPPLQPAQIDQTVLNVPTVTCCSIVETTFRRPRA
jgi:hypothetical protein